ncbi:ArsR/SmtB family transcription factor [Arenibaculum pallidiluteum]|uniref:ArsR/SmtB family transcription factor n=1 Tax=Arenibaculum pallidiluteum TaxID=2812559 RepID=UPI001A9627EE|nr:helix-turn-helix domain-containing protein [Arenibaculum pallidiluteum]
METIPHPEIDAVQLSTVLTALSDPTRLAIVRRLAEAGCEIACSGLGDAAYKTKLSYHLRILREAGLTRTRAEGTSRLVSLRSAEIDSRFPGLLAAVLRAEREPSDLI